MINYKISSKIYVSQCVPISNSESLLIPKKGSFITCQFDKIPYSLEVLQRKNVIIIEEI